MGTGCWNQMISKFPSNQSHSIIVIFFYLVERCFIVLVLLVMLAIRMTVFHSYVLPLVFPADTIDLFYNFNSTVIQVPLLKTGNSWWTDKNVKFRNPASRNLSAAFAGKNGSASIPYFAVATSFPLPVSRAFPF